MSLLIWVRVWYYGKTIISPFAIINSENISNYILMMNLLHHLDSHLWLRARCGCHFLFMQSIPSMFCRFDGFTSTFQDKLFKGYNMDIHNQIFYTTLCSCILSLSGKFVCIPLFQTLFVCVHTHKSPQSLLATVLHTLQICCNKIQRWISANSRGLVFVNRLDWIKVGPK